MSIKTADLCDEFDSEIQVVEPLFSDFGGVIEFSGEIHTVKAFEDNSLVRAALESPGDDNIPVQFGSVTFRPGDYLYADEDGIVVSSRKLA